MGRGLLSKTRQSAKVNGQRAEGRGQRAKSKELKFVVKAKTKRMGVRMGGMQVNS